MRILLINPLLPALTLLDEVIRHEKEKGELIMKDIITYITYPLGLGYLASMAKLHGHEVSILDLNAEVLYDYIYKRKFNTVSNFKQIVLNKLKERKPDLVGLTSITSQFKNAVEIAKTIKEYDQHMLVILGGIHATFSFRDILIKYNKYFDYIVRGEGEITFIELLRALEDGNNLNSIKGLAFMNNGKLIITEEREFIKNLDLIPFPDRDAVEYFNELTETYKSPIITSRGCPFGCIFCSVTKMWSKIMRRRSINNILSEIEYMKDKYGQYFFLFVDDLFVFNKNFIKKFAQEVIKRRLDITWTCNARIDTLDEEILSLMKKSKCEGIFVGIESGNYNVRVNSGKRFINDLIIRIVNKAVKLGIKVRVSFIIGLPGENMETIKDTLKLIDQIDTNDIIVSFLTPLPGTDIYENRDKYGLITLNEENLEKYDFRYPLIEYKDVSREDLVRMYIKLIRKCLDKEESSEMFIGDDINVES